MEPTRIVLTSYGKAAGVPYRMKNSELCGPKASHLLIGHKQNGLYNLPGSEPITCQMKRLIEFDVLRGILLIMMIVNHSPSSLRRLTDQPLGFFTTAECFVFVSAFLAGMLFRKRTEKLGFAAARSSSARSKATPRI